MQEISCFKPCTRILARWSILLSWRCWPLYRKENAVKLNPQHLTVAELLQKRLFRIPDYQRAYSWKKPQRLDLFNDVCEAFKSGKDHFMATVVGLSGASRLIYADRFNVVWIVDGQQRITTLIILLKAIEKALSKSENAEEMQAREGLRRLLVKGDDHNLALLQTNHDSSDVFMNYVRNGKIDENKNSIVTAADLNLVNAAQECEAFVSDWLQDGSLFDLLDTVQEKLSLIYHEIVDEATVYRVFEVLNSRGLDVRWLDKTKSQLMAKIFECEDNDGSRADDLGEMKNVWKDIYRSLGLNEQLGDEALKFSGTWYFDKRPNKVLSEQEAAIVLSHNAGAQISTMILTAKFLKSVVSKVVELHDDQRRTAVTQVAHARFLAISIMLRGFEKNVEKDLLASWERLTFRIFALAKKDSRNKVGDFVRLGYDIFVQEYSAEQIRAAIRSLGEGFDIDEIINSKTWEDWYGGYNEEVRYMLCRYEEYLASENNVDFNESEWAKVWAADPSRSIEHILPQSSGANCIHNLGNLTMLPPGVNSSLKDKPPIEKADRYAYCGMQSTMNIGKAIKELKDHGKVWDEIAVLKRAEDIGKFVRKEWGD